MERCDMYRYKAGELVELSSAGRKLQHNDKVYDMMGIIVRIDNSEKYPYIIQWFGYALGDGTFPMKEYEIKRVRGKRENSKTDIFCPCKRLTIG